MKLYTVSNGTMLDLEHLQAVGPITENLKQEFPYSFTLTLAFGSVLRVAFDDAPTATSQRAALVKAWSGQEVVAQPITAPAPRPAPAAPVSPPAARQFLPPSPPAMPATSPMGDDAAVLAALAAAGINPIGQPISQPPSMPTSPGLGGPGKISDGPYVSSFA